MTELEKFKSEYKPREGYSFLISDYHIGVDPIDETKGKLSASVFKKIIVKDKKEGEVVYECSILNVKDTYSNFVKVLFPYIDKRV